MHSLQVTWYQAVNFVRLSAHISVTPTGWVYVNFDVGGLLWKSVEQFQI